MTLFQRGRIFLLLLLAGLLHVQAQSGYQPSADNLDARKTFAENRFGIFLHWGIYSMFAQGEWYMTNLNIDNREYAKAARGFYPAYFDADAWAKAFKEAGARYICFTTRHHDGFSMFDTRWSDYSIVKSTPYGKDVLRELTDACRRQGLKVHLYYSLIDWTREDYPAGRTGRETGKDLSKGNWSQYFEFMCNQLTELIQQYNPDAIWFDGEWDQPDSFDWHQRELYELIHRLKPSCLIGNNHHKATLPGEDIQIFERDLPGENTAGLSGQSISRLPLETCQTMNGMWGYKVVDQNYKSVKTLVQLLVGAAGKGANLLMNIGPQPSGELPATALERLKGMGEWLKRYGETIYGTTAGDVPTRPWGVTTRKGNKQYVHILLLDDNSLFLPITNKVKRAVSFDTKKPVRFKQTASGLLLELPETPRDIDYIVELDMR